MSSCFAEKIADEATRFLKVAQYSVLVEQHLIEGAHDDVISRSAEWLHLGGIFGNTPEIAPLLHVFRFLKVQLSDRQNIIRQGDSKPAIAA